MSVDGFRFGILDGIVNSRISPSVLPRVGSLTAAATGADSYWVGDHLNSFLPRSIATPEYLGVAAKLVPKIDAVLEPWTMLGHLDDRERRIIISRYGLNGASEQTLEQLGRELGITKERVRQIESRAQDKLRKIANEAKLDLPML